MKSTGQNDKTAQWNLQTEFHYRFNRVMAPITEVDEAKVARYCHKGEWRYTCPGNRLKFKIELHHRLRELAEWIGIARLADTLGRPAGQ